MRRALSFEQGEQVIRLRKEGRALRDIASSFGVSVSAVKSALASTHTRPSPRSPKREDAPPAAQETGVSTQDLQAVEGQIAATLEDLENVVDPKVRGQLRQVLVKLVTQRLKLLPPVPRDPEQDRDMVRAADQARNKLERLVKAAQEGRLK